MPLSQDVLDTLTCQIPGCDHNHASGRGLVLLAVCHPEAGLRAVYENGVLTLRCFECREFVLDVQVASTSDQEIV